MHTGIKNVDAVVECYLSLHCPLLHLDFVCTTVHSFWNELSVYKLEHKKM